MVQRHIQRVHEFMDLDWFGKVAEEPRIEAFLDVAGHGIGTERDYGNMGGRRVVGQNSQRLDAADAGQVDVHQDDIRQRGAGNLDAEIPVPGSQQLNVGAGAQ